MKITLKQLKQLIHETILNEAPRRLGFGGRRSNRYVRPRHGETATGTIYLPTPSAIALWQGEILGQMSDGMWENTKPDNHWVFWGKMNVALGTPKLDSSEPPVKSSYNLAGLLEYVGDRMVNIGRMGKAGADESVTHHGGAEDMPSTFEEFKNMQTKGDYTAGKLQKITDDLAQKYYATKYDMKDLKNDLRSIKMAMKNGGRDR